MNALVYVDIDQGIHKGKMKVARNEKRKKLGFSFYINIGNFEAFLWNLNLSAKHLFWRCEHCSENLLLLRNTSKFSTYLCWFSMAPIRAKNCGCKRGRDGEFWGNFHTFIYVYNFGTWQKTCVCKCTHCTCTHKFGTLCRFLYIIEIFLKHFSRGLSWPKTLNFWRVI